MKKPRAQEPNTWLPPSRSGRVLPIPPPVEPQGPAPDPRETGQRDTDQRPAMKPPTLERGRSRARVIRAPRTKEVRPLSQVAIQDEGAAENQTRLHYTSANLCKPKVAVPVARFPPPCRRNMASGSAH